MYTWNKRQQIDFSEYERLSVKSKKSDIVIIKAAPNCGYCYFCHESTGGGYRVLVKKNDEIIEVLCCYGCYPDIVNIKK